MKKKILAFLMSLVMLLGMIPTTFAESAPVTLSVTPDQVSVTTGTIVTYTVTVKSTAKVSGIQIQLDIPDGMSYVANSGTVNPNWESVAGSTMMKAFSEPLKQYVLATGAADGFENLSSPVVIGTFKCAVEQASAVGYEVGLKEIKISDENRVALETEVERTLVTINVPVTGVTLNKNTMTLPFDSSEALAATVLPDNATDKTVTWSSNDSTVASVDSNGKVTAKKVGTATITATAGGKSATCVVTVTQATPTYTVPAGLTATFGQTLADVHFSDPANGTWSWVDSSLSVGDVGTNEFQAKFTPNNSNYKEVIVSVSVNVSPASMSDVEITLAAGPYTYTGSPIEPQVTSVKKGGVTISPDEYTVSYSNNTNAGTATVTVTDNPNGNYTVFGSKTFTINPKTVTPTIELSPSSFTYGGTSKEPTVTVKVGVKTLVKDTDYTVTYPAESKNAGDYKVTVTLKGNYSGSKDATYTINKANPTYDLPDNLTATYGDTLNDVTLPTGWTWEDDTQGVGNAGENSFKAIYTPNDTANYNTVTVNVPVTVEKATPTVTPPTVKTGLVYDGNAQVLVTAGSTTDGTMYYAIGTTQPTDGWNTEVPTGTDARAYTVWYKVVGDNNHKDVNPTPINVTIAPKAVAKPMADTTVYTYTGSELTYNVVANDGYTVTGNKQTNAGTYKVKVTLKANYVWDDDSTTPVTFQFVINKADATCTAPTANTLTYTGNELVLVTEGSTNDGTMQYAIGTDDATAPTNGWGGMSPKGTDVGTYYVWYYVDGDANHNDSTPACVTVTIGAAVPGTVAVTGVALDKSTLTLTVGGTDTLTAIVTPDNATNKDVIWSTSDSTVATVNNGVVTAVGVGTATITVTTVDGGFTATCAVTVNAAGGSGGGSGSGGGGHYWHYDYNGDGKCDYCGSATNCKHTDANKDGKCDICYACIKHVDKNNDGFCDLCKNKIVESGKTFDAGVVLYAGMAALAATGSAVVIGKKRKSK